MKAAVGKALGKVVKFLGPIILEALLNELQKKDAEKK